MGPVRRIGSNPPGGGSNADEHFHELVGSSSFWIYLTPNTRLKGYEQFRRQVESSGCTIDLANDAPINLGGDYPAIKIAARDETLVPVDVLKLAHRWAHRNDLLHSFFKPALPGLS